MLKNFLKTKTPILFAVLRTLYRTLRYIFLCVSSSIVGNITKYFEKNPCVIMWIDGGFCSQIFRYLKGRWYAQRGFRVKYDITWYENNPVDCLGIKNRDFLLMKCFPHIELKLPSRKELTRYRLLYNISRRTSDRWRGHYSKLKAPMYTHYVLDWVIASEKEFEELAQCLEWEKLHYMLGEEAKRIEASIIQDKKNGLKTIALHVRRGDMASKSFARGGKVLTSEYYAYVLNLAADENSVVYIFSDGFDFVAESVIPHIKCKYVLADKTSSVYEDMFLCSLCRVQVASQGSLGKMAYSFNTNKDRKLIYPFLSKNNEETLPVYYAGSYGTVEFVHLTEDMYEQ